jgi:hypothetical protein
MVGMTAVSLLVLATGGLWALAPKRFVSLYRRVWRRDPYAKTAEWERDAVSVSSRLIGGFLFLVGFMMLWTMYSPFIRSNLSQFP